MKHYAFFRHAHSRASGDIIVSGYIGAVTQPTPKAVGDLLRATQSPSVIAAFFGADGDSAPDAVCVVSTDADIDTDDLDDRPDISALDEMRAVAVTAVWHDARRDITPGQLIREAA